MLTRNTAGFSALTAGDPLADLDIGNPRKWAIFMEDFLSYEIAQAAGNPWTFTQTNCVDTIIGPTGVLVLTLGGADNDAGELQLTEVPFATNSKRMYFEAKVKLTLATGTVAANEMFVGLASEQTTTNFMNAGGTALTVDNCIGFVKHDTDTGFGAVSRNSDVASIDSLVKTISDGVWITLAFYYDGSSIKYYADGALVAELNSEIPTANMTPTLFIKAGEAKANLMSCDYILVAAER
jgi:hypothetical protein